MHGAWEHRRGIRETQPGGTHRRREKGPGLCSPLCVSLRTRGRSARRGGRGAAGPQRAAARFLCQCPVIKMSPFNFQASRSNLFLIKSVIEALLPPPPPRSPQRAAEGAVNAEPLRIDGEKPGLIGL